MLFETGLEVLPGVYLPSFLLFFCEVGELSLNLLALLNLRQREKGERFPTTPVNSPMLGALKLIWQKEKARRDLLLGDLPGCLALHPSPSPDNSIQLTRQEMGVLSRPAAKKATSPSGRKQGWGGHPHPHPSPSQESDTSSSSVGKKKLDPSLWP